MQRTDKNQPEAERPLRVNLAVLTLRVERAWGCPGRC